MRFYTTWVLVMLLSMSLIPGCKKKAASTTPASGSDQVADSGADAGGDTAAGGMGSAGMGAGMGAGMDEGMDEGMDGDMAGMEEGMEEGLEEEGMEDDLAAGFEGDLDPDDEGMDEDLTAGFAGDDLDAGEEGMEDDLTAGFADGTTDPANFGAGGGRRSARKPATMLEASQQAFAQRKSSEGFDYAFAAILLEPKAATELLGQYQWVPALRRPALGVRWGIGVNFIGSKDAAKNPYPIGVEQKLPERGSSRNRNRDGGDDLGDPGGAFPGIDEEDLGGGFPGSGGSGQSGNSDLRKYTGDLGNKVIKRLEGRIERGYYGELLKTALAGGGGAASQDNSGAGFGPGGFDPADEGLDSADEGIDGAGFPGDGGAGFPGAGGGRRGGNSAVLPGVTMLGVGKLDELSAKAQQQGVDVAVIFEVKVSVNRKTKLVTNNTTIQLYDVAMGQVVRKNKSVLNNIKIQIRQKTAKGDEVDEMIEKEIDQIFLAAEAYKVGALPKLTADLVLNNRVIPMVKKDYLNPLSQLAELRYWHDRKLLTTEHLVIACKELLDESLSQQLLSTDPKVQAGLIKTWLPGGTAVREQEAAAKPFR